MSLVRENNYISIQGWMITELKLKGNDLLVYAIIYGFSQDEESKFIGSLQYLADWCNGTKQGIQKNLSNLLERGLITKSEIMKNNIKYCEYSCIPYNSVAHPIQQSCINNIEDKQEENNNISKDILLEGQPSIENDFIESCSRKKVGRAKKQTLYDKCYSDIVGFTNNAIIQDMLDAYLKMRLQMRDKVLYQNQWRGMLTKLSELSAGDDSIMMKIIRKSIEKGWASFYELKEYSKKDPSAEYGEVHADKERKEKLTDAKF